MPPGLITATTRIIQIRIDLADVRPAVWRRVLVPESMTLADLHEVIQGAMGWDDQHLHGFEIDGYRFGMPDPDSDPEFSDDLADDATATLTVVACAGSRFLYVYDFGDCWRHTLHVEATLAPEPGGRYPRCVAGARPCPPEDVGGPGGYDEFLIALRDPKHPDHEEFTGWADGFDPYDFDPVTADKRLEPLAWINGA